MKGRDRLGVAVAGTGLVSLVSDVAVLAGGRPYPQGVTTASAAGFVEVAVLSILTVMAVRLARASVATTAGVLAGLAVPLWLMRFGRPVWSVEVVGGYAAWTLVAVLAVATGLYLRALDRRRTRAVAGARRAQRLELADDLHDFVVHDINEILLQAHAGQVLLGGGDAGQGAAAAQAGAALRRIEQAALRALETIDRTVHVLHHPTGAGGGSTAMNLDSEPRAPQPTAVDLPALADRFTATGTVAAHLELEPGLVAAPGAAPSLPPEISTTVYRIVVEALTNVRRHAVGAGHVRVNFTRVPDDHVQIEIVDDGCGQSRSRHGGFGLAGLAARVDALGGTLGAGPAEPAGWRVTAVLPALVQRFDAAATGR
jgi:signal transduction histidine kinase